MAKVMISIPDQLLVQIDAEAKRQGTTRSGLLQAAARAKLGLGLRSREELLDGLDDLKFTLPEGLTAVEAIRQDRDDPNR